MYIKKNWIYIIFAFIIVLIISFLGWFIYIISIKPIQITVKSSNPQVKNLILDENLFIKTLNDYKYTSSKKVFFVKKPITTRYKKINVFLVTKEQARFAYKSKNIIYAGSGTVDNVTELTINIYISDEYIKKWIEKKDMTYVNRAINRLLLLELYSNSQSYKELISAGSGASTIINLGNQIPPKYLLIEP